MPEEELYRVFPHEADAGMTVPGGPLYTPPPGTGRLDNPGLYATLYASDSAAGAVAEKFGRLATWDAAILEPPPLMPQSRWSLASLVMSPGLPACDLDSARQLLEFGLKPSDVVTRDYRRTRAWARRIFATGRFAAVRWWSYYQPNWGSWGVWEAHRLRVVSIEPLTMRHRAVREAAAAIGRPLAT